MQTYLELLQDELKDAERRLNLADKVGKSTIQKQIRQIKRDIRLNSNKGGDIFLPLDRSLR